MVSQSSAAVFSTTIQAILYGELFHVALRPRDVRCAATDHKPGVGYAVFMFMLAMWILLRERQKPHVNYYMVMVIPGCTLLVLATAVSCWSRAQGAENGSPHFTPTRKWRST